LKSGVETSGEMEPRESGKQRGQGETDTVVGRGKTGGRVCCNNTKKEED